MMDPKKSKSISIFMKRYLYISFAIIILVAAVLLGRFTVTKVDPLQLERAEKEQLGQSMYAHADSCAQDYQDGMQMAKEITDPFLKKKFMLRERYITETDIIYQKDVWMENCMWQKVIYNRYGLGIDK